MLQVWKTGRIAANIFKLEEQYSNKDCVMNVNVD